MLTQVFLIFINYLIRNWIQLNKSTKHGFKKILLQQLVPFQTSLIYFLSFEHKNLKYVLQDFLKMILITNILLCKYYSNYFTVNIYCK